MPVDDISVRWKDVLVSGHVAERRGHTRLSVRSERNTKRWRGNLEHTTEDEGERCVGDQERDKAVGSEADPVRQYPIVKGQYSVEPSPPKQSSIQTQTPALPLMPNHYKRDDQREQKSEFLVWSH